MRCIHHPETDPWINLAAEEFLLKKCTEDVFMLYRNAPSVVVGKHQNTLAEINMDYVRSQDLRVARRLSGGGAVYHDTGNLNFVFIRSGESGSLVDFKGFTRPILDALATRSVNARFEGRNNLAVDGLKFSGNAEHVYKNRVLHHGTLLFDSDLQALEAAIRVPAGRYKDKAVKSVRSRVTNLGPRLLPPLDMQGFINHLMEHMFTVFPSAYLGPVSDDEWGHIRQLAQEKYSRWEWIYGYSPPYEMRKQIPWGSGFLDLSIRCEKGIIREARLEENPDLPPEKERQIESLLRDCPHRETDILKRLLSAGEITLVPGWSPARLAAAMF